MAGSKFQLDFSIPSVRDWEKIAQHELGNKHPWQNLTKKKGGLTVKPYYDRDDYQNQKKAPTEYQHGMCYCQNVPKVLVVDAKAANEEALNHLNSGADGVYFDIQTHFVQPEILLKNIELPYCSVFFSCEDDSISFLHEFALYAQNERKKVSGAFFWRDRFAEGFDEVKFLNWRSFKVGGIYVSEKGNIVDEIVDALCTAVELIDRLMRKGFSEERAFGTLTFFISVTTDFFLSIAKIRALKNLWLMLQEAYRIKNPLPVCVHGYSPIWHNDNFQPHGNLLKQTTAAMAGIMGGCNAITIEPEEKAGPVMVRIARNLPSILKEESHLCKVTDPSAGSFYIESLTNQIAAKAWAKFQNVT
jgi:methylmalonyl-CoA mutase